MLRKPLESSDSIECVKLSYDPEERVIHAGGYYESVAIGLGAFLRHFNISAEDCRQALEGAHRGEA